MTASPATTASHVKPRLTLHRPVRPPVENDAFTAFGRRIIAAAGRRIAAGDADGLPHLAGLASEIDDALTAAVIGLRTAGYSWAEIAARLGTSRQDAHQRWGHRDRLRLTTEESAPGTTPPAHTTTAQEDTP